MSYPSKSVWLIVAALAAAVAFHPGLRVEATETRRVVVEIRKFEFVPQTLVVRPGDVVVWRNMDIVPHTATSQDKSWDSGAIEAGAEREIVITADTLEDYFCRFHPSMVATLDITSE